MNPHDFKSPFAGRCLRNASGDFWAFVPASPPLPFSYPPDLVVLLSNADTALSELAGLGRHLPNPALITAPYMRREAILSSRIEGTRTTFDELLRKEAKLAEASNADDMREVKNYMSAMDFALKRLAVLPLSLRLVKEVHEKLMTGVRGGHVTPGEFRRSQNWIGPPGSNPSNARYVPPPPEELMVALGAWEKFLHIRNTLPDLIQCALMHEHFEALHPFLDGNGRVGRILITLFLIDRKRLSHPILYLSAFLESHRPEYYAALQQSRTLGDPLPWIRLFLAGVEATAREGLERASRLLKLQEVFRKKSARKPPALALLDHLFFNPYITVARAQKLLSGSNPSARQAVEFLEKVELLKEITGRAWRKTYVAQPILDAIDADLST